MLPTTFGSEIPMVAAQKIPLDSCAPINCVHVHQVHEVQRMEWWACALELPLLPYFKNTRGVCKLRSLASPLYLPNSSQCIALRVSETHPPEAVVAVVDPCNVPFAHP